MAGEQSEDGKWEGIKEQESDRRPLERERDRGRERENEPENQRVLHFN